MLDKRMAPPSKTTGHSLFHAVMGYTSHSLFVQSVKLLETINKTVLQEFRQFSVKKV